jgi:TonB family protein
MNAMADALPWIHALGWTLLHFLWQGAIVGLVFALVRASIPKHHCNARYANGLVALTSMAVLPVVTFLILHGRQVAQIEAPAGTEQILPAVVSSVAHGASMIAATAPIDAALPWIVGLWFAGVAFVGLRSWKQWRELAQIARKFAEPDSDLQRIVAALARRFEFVRHIRVLVSDRIDTPTLIGWIKPVILLPTAVALGFPRQQIELILAHELGHLRRYDHLVNLAQALLETLLFYHPVVHWIAREVRNEREICCDTLVLRLTAGEPREYAQTLAALEELRQPPVQLALAASGGVLLERVRRILFATPHGSVTQVGRRMWLPALVTVAVAFTVAMRVDRTQVLQFDGPALAALLPHSTLALPGLDVASVGRIARPKFAVAELPRVAAPVLPPAQETAAAAQPETSPAQALVLSVEPVAVAPAPTPAVEPAPVERVAPIETPVAAAPQPAAAPKPLAAVDAVASADEAAAPRAEPAAAPARPHRMPVATRTVSPEYPSSIRSGRRARVELRFSIARDGSVRDIKVVAEPVDSAFTRAAERALQQWRFDPSTVGPGRVNYRQAFVFAPENGSDVAGTEAGGCVRRTGSLLCQRSEGGEEVSAPVDEQRMAKAANGNAGTSVVHAEQADKHTRGFSPDEAAARADLYRRLGIIN